MPSPRPSAQQPAPTRDRLLVAATALFAEHGFAATSTRAIADAAGCNLALIRHYFGSKEGLLRESIKGGMAEIGGELAALRTRAVSPEDRLRHAIELLLRRFDETRDGGLPIVVRELATPGSSVAPELRVLVRRNLELFAKLVADVPTTRPVDPDVAALLLIGMMQIYFITRPVADEVLGPRSPELLRRLAEEISEMFLHGIGARGRPARRTKTKTRRRS